MKFVAQNVNGARARTGGLDHWLTETLGIVCLKEDESAMRQQVAHLRYFVSE